MNSLGSSGAAKGWSDFTAFLDSWALSWGQHRISVLDISSVVLVTVGIYAAARLLMHFASRTIERSDRLDPSQKALLQKLAGIAVVTIAAMIGIDLLGIDLTALAVFSGALGLAVGFGLQKTLGNLIAGLILLMDKSVKPGDVIVVSDTLGAINKIGIRAVSVITRDGKEHLIPNELLMTERVENWSYSNRDVRLRIPVGVAYLSDLALAQRLMIEAASLPSRVLVDPKPSVWLRGFGDSSVDHDILVWIRDPEDGVGNIQSEILNHLWVMFKANGIEIPFPQRDVHIKSAPDQNISVPSQ